MYFLIAPKLTKTHRNRLDLASSALSLSQGRLGGDPAQWQSKKNNFNANLLPAISHPVAKCSNHKKNLPWDWEKQRIYGIEVWYHLLIALLHLRNNFFPPFKGLRLNSPFNRSMPWSQEDYAQHSILASDLTRSEIIQKKRLEINW